MYTTKPKKPGTHCRQQAYLDMTTPPGYDLT